MAPRHALPVNAGFTYNPYYPPFEEEVISEDETSRVWRDGQGVIKRDRKDSPEKSMSQFLEFPVKSRRDWEDLKWRLDPAEPARYPDWAEVHRQHDNRDYVIGLYICGGYGFPRNLFGEQHLAYAYYDTPDLVHDIMACWLSFYKDLTGRVLAEFVPDYLYIWEDMAFKNGPLISPTTFREFMSPYYTELISHVKRLGLEIVMVDSDGDNRPIFDLFLEAGMNAFLPCEIAANMEPLELRERFGNDFLIIGGIDKRALSTDFAAIDHEVMRKVPKLLETGRYIPTVDHSCPPDIAFENYRYYVELLRNVCGG